MSFETSSGGFRALKSSLRELKAVRPWTRTGRIQYSSKRVVGDRFALLGHAAGFIDPLYSKGLYTSLTGVSVLADLLLEAKLDGDYSAARFRPLETTTLAFIRANDRLVANSYRSFTNPKLWNVYSVVWLLGAYSELVKLSSVRALSKGRRSYYAGTQDLRLVGGGFAEFRAVADAVDTRLETLDLYDEAAVDRAVADISTQLGGLEWLPQAFREVLGGKTYLPQTQTPARTVGPRYGLFRAWGLPRTLFQRCDDPLAGKNVCARTPELFSGSNSGAAARQKRLGSADLLDSASSAAGQLNEVAVAGSVTTHKETTTFLADTPFF